MRGWRGVAMTGFVVPESVRWLAAKGRFAEAAHQLGLARDKIPLPTILPVTRPRGSLAELYHKPGLLWQTVVIWGGSASAAYGYYPWGRPLSR
jgi:MFS transporter, putative metabolite:H+ symporter